MQSEEATVLPKNSPSIKKNVIPPGFILEYRIKRLLFHMGYFVKNGVIMKTSNDENALIVTDLDVFGVYVHRDFSSKTIWADCKSGKAKVHERISWIKGIMSTLNIDDTIFVKQGIRTEVKKYAQKTDIQIMELNVVDKLEKDYKILQHDWSGSWDYKTQYYQGTIFSKINVPTNDLYKRIYNFIVSDYWVMDSYSSVKKIITALRELSKMDGVSISPEETLSIKWAKYELIGLFLLSTLNISKELYYLKETEKKEIILESLSSGEISNKKRAEIFGAAFKLAYSLVQKQIPDYIAPEENVDINLTPPKYADAFIDLIMRMNSNPDMYYDLLRYLDYILMEFDFKSLEIDESKVKDIFPNPDNLTLGAKTILNFICQVTGISKADFQLIK